MSPESPTAPPEDGVTSPEAPSADVREQKHYEAVRRALQRILTEDARPAAKDGNIRRLPNWKAGFPRMLCLDMNQWIYLARAHYGRNPTPGALSALQAIRRGLESGQLIVPIASTNVLEAGESSNPERRERLARFMVDLSTNLSVVNHDVIARAECKLALMRKYQRTACVPIRSQLVHLGLAPAFGVRFSSRNESFNEIYSQVQDAPELTEFLLAHVSDGANRDREVDERALRLFQEIRKLDGKLPLEERRRLEIRNAFDEGQIADRLFEAADELGIARDALRNWLESDSNRQGLHECIPSSDITLALIVAQARNRDHVNDLKDYGFLTVVVPYANYVVTERSWAHLLNVTGMSRKYHTHVFGDLDELARKLEGDLARREGPVT